jgi:hypothetical protein
VADPVLSQTVRQPGFSRVGLIALIVWLAASAALLLTHERVFDAMSMDDFMRLTEVRDLLGGQNWFDLTQYRLDPPRGVLMHWSRIVDLPIAGLILLLTLLFGRAGAEIAASAIWPILLLLPALVLIGMIARRLSNQAALFPAILLTAVCTPALTHFRPGALDHHGIQLVLLFATIYGLSGSGDKRAWPLVAGSAAALSLAIGLEMAPVLAAILAAIGLRWVMEGERVAKLLSNFGLAFGAGTAIFFAATVPYARWTASACDQISPACVAAAGLSGGFLATLSLLKIERPTARFVVGLIAGIVAAGVTALAFPACLRDPYANFDARLASVWLNHVAEAQNIFALAHNAPADLLLNYAAPFVALILAALAMFRAKVEERVSWFVPFAALLALFLISLWEIRGATGANMTAIPLLAAAIVCFTGARSIIAHPRAALVLLALSAPVLALAGKTAAQAAALFHAPPNSLYTSGPLSCSGIKGIAPLAALPPGLVLSHLDLGPAILAGTKHSVLAGPYHRNIDGNRAAFDILLGDDTTAERLLHQRHINYVAICPGAPERYNLRKVAPEGLSERLARGEAPAYLEPLINDPSHPLRLFRVR